MSSDNSSTTVQNSQGNAGQGGYKVVCGKCGQLSSDNRLTRAEAERLAVLHYRFNDQSHLFTFALRE